MEENQIIGHRHDGLRAQIEESIITATIMGNEPELAILQKQLATIENLRNIDVL